MIRGSDTKRERWVGRVGPLLQTVVLVLVPLTMSAQFDLSSLQWKKRVLLIFASEKASPSALEQRGIVDAASCGMRERDIAVVLGFDSEPLSVDGRLAGIESAHLLRKRFGVESHQFRVLLIGKDGGVKLNSGKPISADELFGRIDSMPMRRSEMRRRGEDPCFDPE